MTALSRALLALFALLAWLPPRPVAAQGERGATLVVAVASDPQHFNPAITTAAHTHAVADSLFNGLLALDRAGRPGPDLAREWSVEDGGRTYRFKLVRDARWHDGEPVTADDVVFTFNELLLKHHARTKASFGPVLDRIEAPDRETVVMRLKRPYAALLQQLDVTEAPILPKHVYGGAEPNTHPANLKPIGSGPYKLSSYQRENQTILVRNPAYFKPGLPRIERLVFRVIPDQRTAALALSRGEIDLVRDVTGPDLEMLRRDPNIVLEPVTAGPGGGNCIMTVGFNLQRPIWADVRVRRAFAHAIDRERIRRDVIFGQGRVARAPISSGIGWAHAAGTIVPERRDVAAAQKLLDEAGLPPRAGSVRFKIDIVHFPQFGRYAEAMKQDLAEVGVQLAIRGLERGAMIDAVFTKRDFDLTLISYCNGLDPEIGVRRMYVSTNIGNVPFSNAAAYRNVEVDQLFEAASAAPALAERGAHYRRIQEIVVRELPYWWLVETDFTLAHRVAFEGFAGWRGQFAEEARGK